MLDLTKYGLTHWGASRRGTHPYALRPGRHVGFFWNNKICFNFVSFLFEKIKLTVSERTYIIVPMVQLGFMKFKQHELGHILWDPTWSLWAAWLADFAAMTSRENPLVSPRVSILFLHKILTVLPNSPVAWRHRDECILFHCCSSLCNLERSMWNW